MRAAFCAKTGFCAALFGRKQTLSDRLLGVNEVELALFAVEGEDEMLESVAAQKHVATFKHTDFLIDDDMAFDNQSDSVRG